MPELNSNEIQKILPHRYPFLLVDRITDYKPGEWAQGLKCVSANERFFTGHFPEQHVMPGVLIIEALAQVGAIALLCEENQGQIAYLAGIDKARFKARVIPGDVLVLECKLTKRRGSIGWGQGVALVDEKIAASAELLFALGTSTL